MFNELEKYDELIKNAELALARNEERKTEIVRKGNPLLGEFSAPITPEEFSQFLSEIATLFDETAMTPTGYMDVPTKDLAGRILGDARFSLHRLEHRTLENRVASLKNQRNARLREVEDQKVKPILATLKADIADEASAKAVKEAIVTVQTSPEIRDIAAKREPELSKLIEKAKAKFVDYITFA